MTTTVAGDSRLAGQEYRFSLERLEELNRSAVPLLLARLGAGCPSFGKAASDIDDPAALVAEIRANCAAEDGYISSSMPLQEILFRTLLLNGGEPISLSDLHSELTERWSSPIRPITLTLNGLARVLDNDGFYGFAAVPMAEPDVEEADLPMLTTGEADLPELVASAAPDLDLDAGEDEEEDIDEDDNGDDLFDEDEDPDED